jgi:hypothetical protein
MRKSLLSIFSALALCVPSAGFAQGTGEMPTYCAGSATNSSEGNHYGPSSVTVSVNGQQAFSKTGISTSVSDFTSECQADIKPGDEISVKLEGSHHLQWGVAEAYVDWNADGEFSSDETFILFENRAAGDLADYATSNSFSYTATFTVPATAVTGSFAFRIGGGEAHLHNTVAYDACNAPRRGKLMTFRFNCVSSVNFAVPSASDYEHLSDLTFTANDDVLAAGTSVSLLSGTPVTINATPAAGYQIASITVDGQPVANGGSFNLSSDMSKDNIEIITGQSSYKLNIVNEHNLAYTLTKVTGEEIDSESVLEGTDLKLTLTVPNTHVLLGVILDGAPVQEADGAYYFTMPANAASLVISSREKVAFNVSVVQPEIGGRVIVTYNNGESDVTIDNEASVLEGSVLRFTNERNAGYTFNGYTVNGENYPSASYTVNSDVTVSALFVEGIEYPAMKRYYTNNLGQQNRYIKKFTTTDTQTPEVFSLTSLENDLVYYTTLNEKVEEGAIVDKTANPIMVLQGTTSFSFTFETWRDSFTYSSYTCNPEIDWTQLAYYVDWNGNGEFIDENEYYTREQGSMVSGKFANPTTKTVNIPDGVAPGTYRMRLIFNEPASASTDWTTAIFTDASYGPCELRNGVAYDFDIVIVKAELEKERTVTIAANDDNAGVVAFVPAQESNSLTTKDRFVIMEATPAEGASFINWVNSDNEEASVNRRFSYSGETDAAFTANFGWNLTYRVVEGSGSVSVNDGENALSSNSVVMPGTQITIAATPSADYGLQRIVVNGVTVEIEEDNTYTTTVNSGMNIEVYFVEQTYTFTVNAEGNGTWKAGVEADDATGLPLPFYSSGDFIASNSELFFAAIPNEGETVESIEYVLGDNQYTVDVNNSYTYEDGEDCWKLEDGTVCFYCTPGSGEVIVNVKFTTHSHSIDGINVDSQSEVEYFNLQGIKVEAKNLTPGFYILKQDGKTAKKFIGK